MRLRAFLTAVLLPVFFSCASGPVAVSEDTPPAKIIQLAQGATDINKYKIAVKYYEILLERYGNDHEYYCTGKYEIAFIRYKQRKYAEAREGMEDLLVLFEAPGAETLPQRFRILAETVLNQITAKGH